MQLGMIGLGRMGGNIVRRLMKNGHTAVVYDKDAKAVAGLAGEGATGASTLEDFVEKLEKPRTAWVMLPAGKITEATMRGDTDFAASVRRTSSTWSWAQLGAQLPCSSLKRPRAAPRAATLTTSSAPLAAPAVTL